MFLCIMLQNAHWAKEKIPNIFFLSDLWQILPKKYRNLVSISLHTSDIFFSKELLVIIFRHVSCCCRPWPARSWSCFTSLRTGVLRAGPSLLSWRTFTMWVVFTSQPYPYLHMYVHTYVDTYVCTYICTYLCIYAHVCMYMCIYVHTYVHT
jgi:hypothetical protein